MSDSNGRLSGEFSRVRPVTSPRKTSSSLYIKVDESRWLRPTLIAVAAATVGVLLAPEWAIRQYPTDPALIGTPAPTDIKAEYDDRGDIVDEVTTARLRDEAVAKTKRIYDFDARLGERLAEQVDNAASAARDALAGIVPEAAGADSGSEAAPKPALARGATASIPERPSRERVAAARAAFEAAIGIELDAADAAHFAARGYSLELVVAVGDLLRAALRQPVLRSRSSLEPDRQNGIVVRQLGDDTDWIIADVDSITDIDTLRASLPRILEKVLRGEGGAVGPVAGGEGAWAEGEGAAPPDAADLAGGAPSPNAGGARAAGGARVNSGSDGAIPSNVEPAVVRLARRLVQPSLTFNRRDTEVARADASLAVTPVTIAVKRGQMIIRDGEVFTDRHLLILEHMARYSHDTSIFMVAVGATLLVLLLVLAGISFSSRRRDPLSARDAMFLTTVFIGCVVVARLWMIVADAISEAWPAIGPVALLYLMPLAAGAMLVRLVLRMEIALIFAVIASLVLGLLAEGHPLITLYTLVGSVLGATTIGTMSRRGDLLRAGLWVAGAQAAAALGMQLFAAESDVGLYVINVAAAAVSGILAGLAALAITPLVESVFRYTTDLKLLELANLNHPALKELIVQAPGTYHHSIIVGSLVEAAAEAIGANALLAKVMAYYHDLGKGCNAMYFIENQRGGSNPHDKLKPSMSAMIIRRHVTDGLDLADRYALGEEIEAGIAEHHGTTLIQYFYHRAQEDADPDTHVSESDYRYPGRKPQSRETALVMLGDSVEAASRSLSDPTPARLQGLVNKIINVKFTDNQLEDCDLTLKDLHTIAKAFMGVLNSIYHHRVEYPEPAAPKRNDDTDPKNRPPPRQGGADDTPEEDRPDNIRRLGLTGR